MPAVAVEVISMLLVHWEAPEGQVAAAMVPHLLRPPRLLQVQPTPEEVAEVVVAVTVHLGQADQV